MIRNAFIVPVLLLLNQYFSVPNFSVQILTATQQSWSVGIAGARGEKFHLEIQTTKENVPDTFHLNGYAIRVRIYPENQYGDYNCTQIVKGNSVTYKLNFNFSYPNPYSLNTEGNEADFPKPKKYKCNYELIFKNKESLCISKYETLPPLAYP
ncbi:MAG: hypothetical protein WCI97_00840 [Bacteroidota bacterium]